MPSLRPHRKLAALLGLGLLLALPAAAGATGGLMQSAGPSPWHATAPKRIPTSGSVVAIVGKTHLDHAQSPLVLVDVGTVTGTPYGKGSIELTYTLHPKWGIATTAFTITTATGTITGRAVSHYAIGKVTISFSGVGRITGGTGAFAGTASGVLEFNALHSLTGKREVIRFLGSTLRPGARQAG